MNVSRNGVSYLRSCELRCEHAGRLVHSHWFQGAGSFILDPEDGLSQSALSWHVPVKY